MILKKDKNIPAKSPAIEGVKYSSGFGRATLVIITLIPITYTFLCIICGIPNPFDYCACAFFQLIIIILTKCVFSKMLIGVKWRLKCCCKIDYDFPEDNSMIDPKDVSTFIWTLIMPLPYWITTSLFVGYYTEIFYFYIYLSVFILQATNSILILIGYRIALKSWEKAESDNLEESASFQDMPEKFQSDNPEVPK